MNELQRISVIFDGQPIGCVEISERSSNKIRGQFIFHEGFSPECDLIHEARAWAKQFDDSHERESLDYLAFDKYVDTIKRLTPRIAIPDLPTGIQEFAVDQDLAVEITLGDAVA